jgi:hypothetical protein
MMVKTKELDEFFGDCSDEVGTQVRVDAFICTVGEEESEQSSGDANSGVIGGGVEVDKVAVVDNNDMDTAVTEAVMW